MSNEIRSATSRIIYRIYDEGNFDRAILANLRSSSTIMSKQATNVWPILLSELDYRYLSKNGLPTYAEIAIYSALKCYAIYQQGNENNVYASIYSDKDKGLSLFQALANARIDVDLRNSLDRRIEMVLSNTNPTSTIKAIIHLIGILKSNNKNLKIDFSQLSQDLFYFQIGYESARQICLKWGEQYYGAPKEIKGE